MSQDKDEIVKMAREAGAIISPQWGVASNVGTATFERFATLCRAPLVEEVERLKKDLSTVDVILEECKMDWSGDVTQIKAEQVCAARIVECASRLVQHADFQLGGILSAASKAKDIPSKAVSQVKSRHLAALRDALSAIPPQHAAQEPPSAVPVVEQLLSALMYHRDQTRPINTTTEAIEAGQKFIKENGK